MLNNSASATNTEGKSKVFIKNLFPKVLRSNLKVYEFEPEHIKRQLLKETSISEKDAERVTIEVVRSVIRICESIKVITGPMLRELTNSVLLQFGLEVERLENTRVGYPLYELKKIKDQGRVNGEVNRHVWNEFENVRSIIKRLKENNGKPKELLPKITKGLIGDEYGK